MKRKLLFAIAALLCSVGTWAQTDVTSTYLTNADFSQTTALTGTYLYGYGKDGSPYGFQTIDGWTSVVTSGDNTNNSYPNSGTAAGVFSYGSSTQLKGNAKAAPATNPNGEASGNCFGFFGVWGCGGYYYQNVTLAAGKYTITVPMYSQSGTQANTTYTGFFPTSGTNRTVAVNPTVGQWVNQTVTFTLADETAGQIRIGYQSTGSGSGANPMLFIDCVKIEFTAIVVKDVLETALTAANNANTTLGTLTDAIATAQAVYDDEDATQEQVNAAAATLNAAVELAMSAAGDVTGIFLSNPGFESSTETTTNAAAGGNAAPVDIAGGWTQNSSAAWSSSAVVSYGGSGQVNGVSAPSADNAGNTGKTLGVSVGWDGLVTYQSAAVTLPAGVYTLKVYGYNALSGVTQFTSKFGFVPTSGTSTLSTKKSFAYGEWVEDKVTLTLNEATEGKIQVGGQAISGGSGSNAKVFFDNITITYSSFLAGAKAAWDEAVAAAEQAKTDCPNVTGEELTALNAELAKAEPTTIEGYNEATEAIEAATATFTAAKGVYDAYAEIRGVAVALGVTPGDAPANAAAAPAATHALNVAVYTATKADNIFDVTDVYAPSWTSMDTNTGQHWSGDTSISYADKWEGNAATTTRTATITLPAGEFILMSAGRGSENETSTMSANGTTVTFASNGDTGKGIDVNGAANFEEGTFANDGIGRGWEWRYIPVTLTEETAVTVTQTLTRSGAGWGSFCDFRILKKGVVADAEDYAALNTAIENAEAKTLGFEDGQYAPYNNVAALEALAAAKAFDQTATNEKETVEAVTASLTGATWTANDGDVDAIFNGMFDSDVEGDWGLTGWTRTNAWGQQQTGVEGNYATAYYNQPGSLQYGNQGVYTMPLAANTAYQLTFSYRSHENNSNNGVTVSVLNGEDGMPAATFTKNGSTSDWADATAYFTTGAAGNYVLTLANSGNTWMTNVSLVKFEHAASIDLDEEEGLYRDFDRTYAKTVTVERTVKDGFNTVCMPFDLTAEQVANAFGENAKVYEFSENSADANDVTINFNAKNENTIAANVPVLIGNATASTETKTFNNVMFMSGEAKVAGTNFDFVGTYEGSTTIEENDYFIGNGAIYKSTGNTTIKAFHAYLDNKVGATEARLFIDGVETTGINEVIGKMSEVRDGSFYDLQGRKVANPSRGLYIINGHKVVVK